MVNRMLLNLTGSIGLSLAHTSVALQSREPSVPEPDRHFDSDRLGNLDLVLVAVTSSKVFLTG
jgi:hypothetical protein